ncbi:MAG: RecQ family ATP-dependent DNA helicase [Candidatus Kapabacteria bacterium]|nr:RecQ family ATP-dependent DNA helicase [Candidatus Kapabacteria bacterium]
MFERARTILRDVFGHPDFRGGQDDILRAVLSGRDVLGVLPTGGGKSLCYQIPAMLFPHTTLVISPLVALMQDQTQRLAERGVAAACIHSGIHDDQIDAILRQATAGKLRLLYIAPERLESASFRARLQPVALSLVAVDEAHCVSEWGHDFRPSYRRISTLFESRSRVPIVALTATATPDVRRDIAASLGLRDHIEIVRGFHRPNLTFRVEETGSKIEFITRLLRQQSTGSTIIYAGSRRRVETIADELRKRGIDSMAYHAGLDSQQRADVQDRFIGGSGSVLVATNAFGMGIDKADVRRVIHTDLTLTLEAYYQEAGRAGRDGKPAECILLYQRQDRQLMDFFISGTHPEPDEIRKVYQALAQRMSVPVGMASSEPILADAESIAAELHTSIAVVNGALTLLERHGLVIRTSAHGQARVQLRTTAARLQQYANQAPVERRMAADFIVRRLSHLEPGGEIELPLSEMLRRTDLAPAELAAAFSAMHMAQLIRYRPPQSGGGVMVLGARLLPRDLPLDIAALHERRAHAVRKLEIMIGYAETRQCKQNFILSYFGDASGTLRCGRCSSCLQQTGTAAPSERQQPIIVAAIDAAWQLRGRFGRHVVADVVRGVLSEKVQQYRLDRASCWSAHADRSRAEVLEAIDEALSRGWLVRSADMYPTIGVTDEGLRLLDEPARPLDLRSRPAASPNGPDAEETHRRLNALSSMRERLAARSETAPEALATDEELLRIAQDSPSSMARMIPGRHGSGLFIARYGADVLETLRQVDAAAQSKPHVEELPAELVEILRKSRRTFGDVVRDLRMTPPAASYAIEKAIERYSWVERSGLVDDDLYAEVLDYVRYHRYAKIRHVREHLQREVDLPVLRVALAFARRDLSQNGL